jgi:hypothetical protein
MEVALNITDKPSKRQRRSLVCSQVITFQNLFPVLKTHKFDVFDIKEAKNQKNRDAMPPYAPEYP